MGRLRRGKRAIGQLTRAVDALSKRAGRQRGSQRSDWDRVVSMGSPQSTLTHRPWLSLLSAASVSISLQTLLMLESLSRRARGSESFDVDADAGGQPVTGSATRRSRWWSVWSAASSPPAQMGSSGLYAAERDAPDLATHPATHTKHIQMAPRAVVDGAAAPPAPRTEHPAVATTSHIDRDELVDARRRCRSPRPGPRRSQATA